MSNIDRRGSNLPSVGATGLAQGIVISSKVAAPAAAIVGGAGVVVAADLLYAGTNANVPHIITNIPGIGHPITSALMDMGNAIHGFETSQIGHVAIAGGAVAVGAVAYKKIGKPVQASLKRVVRRHGL